MRKQTAPVLVVAGGNHVTVLVDATEMGNEFDLIEVLAGPGGGPRLISTSSSSGSTFSKASSSSARSVTGQSCRPSFWVKERPP